MKSTRFRLLLMICLLALLPAALYARAGGGEGFGGGGGGGGHGGGGGSGSGGWWLLIQFLIFCVEHPIFGLIVLAVIVIFFVYAALSKDPKKQAGGQTTSPPRLHQPHGNPVALLRGNDPTFSPDQLCSRVSAGFMKLQTAWCHQDLAQVRPFISDGIHERFSLQFAEQKAEGYRDYMDRIGIDHLIIVDAHSDEIYDEVSLEIAAHAADYKVSLADGTPIAGRAGVEPFAEVWTFLRRRGAKTAIDKPGLMEGNCPNCGSPIEINESANCTNCSALLRSGQYDWVLTEITQSSEWNNGRHDAVPGLAALRKQDPDLNVQSLEDRTSVIFWRKAAADRIGKIDPMFKVTSPSYLPAYIDRLKSHPDQGRHYHGSCAVGSVDVEGFIPAPDDRDMERALIGIRWSGIQMLQRPDGTAQPADEKLTHHTLFVLMRKPFTKTDAAKGISSAHCPNCGAPESGGVHGACDFCGTALNDGSTGWVLENILSYSDPQAQEMLQATRA